MLNTLKKIWIFAGVERSNINQSVILSFFYAVFHMLQIGAIYYVILALLEPNTSSSVAWVASGLIIASIAGRAILNCITQLQQTHAGYFMAANKRIFIGDKLKRVPMGYFSEHNLGEITGVATTVLGDVENTAPVVLVTSMSGLINALVFTVMVLIFDWRIGLLVMLGTVLYLLITSAMEGKSASLAAKRQESAAKLVSTVLEQVQGMPVIKAFNLTGRGDQKVRDALSHHCKSNLDIERMFTPYIIAQKMVLYVFSIAMMAAAVLFYINGSMPLTSALMTVIMSFLVFAQIESAGSGMATLRVVSSSIDQANQLDSIPQMDEKGADIQPENHTITFDHVNFSYGSKETLHDISAVLPDKTTTAVIGPSGSGKTTLCNLVARFWDVDSGSVKIGGIDVREYTLEALMDQVSMVFQTVYLFADTIENNIKFGQPEASHAAVVAAAKKTCCHDFITALPDGYQTVIGEGGASLSGGEKQRISLARAMLKDAPIIILDEATANVDPENEAELQVAIETLTHNKTILMIAHRLKTVRNADQILVVDGGHIVQRGRHDDLMREAGIYAEFVSRRKEAASWKLEA